MINIFGTTISAPPVLSGQLYEGILTDVAKKADERKLLRSFLDSPSLAGISRLEEIIKSAKTEAANLPNVESSKPQAIQFYLSQLKQSHQSNGQSSYEDLILKIISTDGNFPSAPTARKILQGKTVDLPDSFPVDHNKAENLFYGTLSSSIGECQCREYQTYQLVKARIQDTAKDLFLAVNHGLSPQDSQKFLAVTYELYKLQTADPTNIFGLKQNIISAISSGQPLDFFHIKCLRFVYPNGNRLLLLNHTRQDIQYDRCGQSRRPQDEAPIFAKLEHILRVFGSFDVPAKLTVLLSDQDLLDYFPDNSVSGLFPDGDFLDAKSNLEGYLLAVSKNVPFGSVNFLRHHLQSIDKLVEFDQLRSSFLKSLYAGKSLMPEAFVESKVDYRYKSNVKIFVNPPSRQFARDRVYAQLASLQALSVLGQNIVLIEEDHGNDNNYIGGYKRTALPVFFTDLRSTS